MHVAVRLKVGVHASDVATNPLLGLKGTGAAFTMHATSSTCTEHVVTKPMAILQLEAIAAALELHMDGGSRKCIGNT